MNINVDPPPLIGVFVMGVSAMQRASERAVASFANLAHAILRTCSTIF